MGETREKYWVFCIYVALALSTFVVFWQVRHHEFISFDDDLYIFNNSHVEAGLTREGLVWAFTKTHAYNWHPLTWLSHMLDCEFYGLEAGGHHFTNVLFHIASTLLLLSVLKRTTGSFYSSAFVAALFALHPLHVESVAWASERKDVLSGFFWIFTMWAYVRYTERPNVARYLLTVLALCLGLMAKQMLVTLPFVLLLLDYWPLGRFTFKGQSFCNSTGTVVSVSVSRCILEKMPLLILSVVASMVVYFVQRQEGTVKSFMEYPSFYRIANAMVAYVVYIGKMLWPANLAIFYPHQRANLPTWQIMGSALLLECITIAVLWKVRQKPYLAVGWLWYLGTLVPVIGLVQVGLQAYADRYTYMTLTGLFMIIAWGVPDIFARLHYRKAILSSSAVLLLLALGITARHQVGYWRNSMTLYGHAMVVVQNNWRAHNMLGKVLESHGKLDEAISHLAEVLRIDFSNADAKNSLGKALLQRGRVEEAVELHQQFLPTLPDDINAPNAVDVARTRGGKLREVVRAYIEAHANLGKAFFQRGEIDEAIRHYEEVLRYRSEFVDTHKDLGSTFLQQGRFEEAIRVYRKVLQILPDDPDAHRGLGVALFQQGKLNAAIRHYEKVLRFQPEFVDTHKDLGSTLVQQGKLEEAIRVYQKVLQIMPDDPNVLNAIGIVLGRQGKLAEAIEYFTEALRVKPDFAEARSNLRRAQAMRDKLDEIK